jgi:hypothetical protein
MIIWIDKPQNNILEFFAKACEIKNQAIPLITLQYAFRKIILVYLNF